MPTETAAEATRRIVPEDLFRLHFLSDPRISPDGTRVAYVVTTADREDNEYRSHIWLAATDGSRPPRRFTNGPKRDQDPQWSPDGRRLAFVSRRSGHAEVWVIPTDGGEAQRLTFTPNGATTPRWRPDSRALVFLTGVREEDPAPGSAPIETDKEREARREKRKKVEKDEPRRITHMKYKSDGQGFLEDYKTHLWVVELDDDGAAAGPLRRLTDGDWDDAEPAWSPDGQWIAFCSNRTPERDLTWRRDVWVVPAAGGEAHPITGGRGRVEQPAWSPDGRLLAYVGHEDPDEGGFGTNQRLYIVRLDGDAQVVGERHELSADLDLTMGSHVMSDMRAAVPNDPPAWTPDSAAIYYLVTDAGRVGLYRFDLSGDAAPFRILYGDRAILNISLSADGTRLAYDVTDPTNPGDVFTCTLTAAGRAGEEQQLTHANGRYFAERDLAPVEEMRFAGADGTALQGWIMRPPDYQPGQTYPAIVEVHGGPHFLYGFSFFHEFQTLAAQGNIVFFMNPRGSQGYGEGFAQAIRNRWGVGPDYEDLMAGVDALVATGEVDPARLGLTGGSYGGYMTCWIVGHTDRFRVAVAQRSLTNILSFYGTSDVGWLLSDWEFGGLHATEDAYQHYWRMSPLAYAAQVTTPLLLVHPEQDLRCPIGESEQFYAALKRLGKTAELVRFPGASHGLSRTGPPVMRVHRLHTIADWLARYLEAAA